MLTDYAARYVYVPNRLMKRKPVIHIEVRDRRGVKERREEEKKEIKKGERKEKREKGER